MLGDTWQLYLGIYLIGFGLSLFFYKKNRKQYTFLMIYFALSFLSALGNDLDFALLTSNPTDSVRHSIETVMSPLLSLVDIASLIMLLVAVCHPIPVMANSEKNSDNLTSVRDKNL